MFNKRLFEDFRDGVPDEEVMRGKFQIQFSGQPAVKSPASDQLFFFDYQTKSD